ncbi:copper chaperone PCu(A)C [Thalassospira profundimaris]|uniref:copper chaperone PCu(A)C n=1 Tax=Thalassospira profundimaris TaxID=502049 RepID=UPI000DEE00AF|nr:copper chaperone PCu(A)C [Thalassospira profundimaris]
MRKSFFAGAAIVAALLASFPAFAGDISISNAWSKESIGRVPNGAVFFTIENAGAEDRIIGATSSLADKTELHTHIMDGNVMKMRQVDGGVEVPAHGAVAFKPGSYHVMLIGLHDPLKAGQHIALTLQFEKAGDVPVDAEVLTLDEASKMASHGAMKMDMKQGMKPDMKGAMDHSGGMGKMKN